MFAKWKKGIVWLLTALFVLAAVTGCTDAGMPESSKAGAQNITTQASVPEQSENLKQSAEETETQGTEATDSTPEYPDRDGSYTSKDEVALYLHIYGELPGNFITKKEAQQLGWDSKKGNLWEVAPGKSIGGSHFGNYEGQLPEKKGRDYYECDLDYEGGYRGEKRLVYSDDGLIFYTEDHYKTFEKLY